MWFRKFDSKIYRYLENLELFKSFSDADLKILASLFELKEFEHHTNIVDQGEHDSDLFILLSGQVVITKKVKNGLEQKLGTIRPGDLIGEMSLLTRKPRTATATTLVQSKFLTMANASFLKLKQQHHRVYQQLMHIISHVVASRLDNTSQQTILLLEEKLRESELRVKLSTFFTTVLVVLSIYVLSVGFLDKMIQYTGTGSSVSFVMLIICNLLLLYNAKSFKIPLATYGITSLNAKKSIKESILITFFICSATIIFKWIMIHSMPQLFTPDVKLFEPLTTPGKYSFYEEPLTFWVILIAYILFCPLQELMFRGFILGSCRAFMNGRHIELKSNCLTALLFSMSHIHIVPLYSFLIIPFGLLWGYMAARHKNLIGCTLSHILTGIWIFYILGTNTFVIG